jgi:hypothetical protein
MATAIYQSVVVYTNQNNQTTLRKKGNIIVSGQKKHFHANDSSKIIFPSPAIQ